MEKIPPDKRPKHELHIPKACELGGISNLTLISFCFPFVLVNYPKIISDNSLARVELRMRVYLGDGDGREWVCLIFSSYFMKMLFLSGTEEPSKRKKTKM